MIIQFKLYDAKECSLRGGKARIASFDDLNLTIGLGRLVIEVGTHLVKLENVYVYDFARDLAGATAAVCLGAKSSMANIVDTTYDLYLQRIGNDVECKLLDAEGENNELVPISQLADIVGGFFLDVCDSVIREYSVTDLSTVNEIRRCAFIFSKRSPDR